ncbi:FYVE/PHD zinc finger [Glarea lozoyensis ATCC 20868]|uniref:FYVE/PHD zinc finger n=1 Tax=Glarea lozoyensis (strain ATCC 20868 / MF5171) TaxID=1116229 RepID=S3CLK4_GLAL2|nr:FYVE/PHD zinc finger [Glarea lozoyensis ATCC 20868]EPE26089.1 FYVE/PHD zinc finger [Glarea lozoyensis ATCC 20868]
MTERHLSITTQIATPIQASLNSAVLFSANDAPLVVAESVDEEPYTIKCICDYNDDDGNTIYCETCDTWQHIECFYPGRVDDASKPDFDHSCTDCKPRILDGRFATERQRDQRQNKTVNENGDRKAKRPPSKSHKKKPKPSELQVNGIGEQDGHKNGSPQDHHPPTKKAKGHRSTHSINSQAKRSPPLHQRPNNHIHPPSPAHTPPDLPHDFQFHSYSDHFLRLYDNEDAVKTDLDGNSMANLSVTNSLSSWLRDPESLQKDTGIRDKDEVFQNLKIDNIKNLKWPALKVEKKYATINDTPVSWRLLTTPTALSQAGRIGELFGLVGFQKDYCEDPENGWKDTVHPKPFVFFHPRLPLCLDTRLSGSIMRYTRRSCRANTTLETFIFNNAEYHFWLVSERPLTANEQITLPWDFRFPTNVRSRYLHLLNLGEEDGLPFDGSSISDIEYEQLTVIIDLVLSEHGGCACDLGNDCAFVRFHRNYNGRSQPQSNGGKAKKGRKTKQNHVSPTSTGQATNSRAASEGQHENGDDDDSRSISGSSRGKPHSRDLTPLHGVSESNGANLDASDREKRKLAMLEDTFRKMEQGPPRKKKRPSDGPGTNSGTTQSSQKQRQRSVVARPSISHSAENGTTTSRGRQYVDASTSRRQSGSPNSATSPTAVLPSTSNQTPRNVSSNSGQGPSTPSKCAYTDSSAQTDDVEDAWWKECKPRTKRRIISLGQRLLKNRHKIQIHQEKQMELQMAYAIGRAENDSSPLLTMDSGAHNDEHSGESPVDSKGRHMSVSSSTPSVDAAISTDVNMTDAPTITISNSIKPPPPPWPGQVNTVTARAPSPNQRSPELRVQLPPSPSFTTQTISGSMSGSVTPSSASAMAQSPFGSLHFPIAFSSSSGNGVAQHPSPVKTKKMSLSDYKAARLRKNDTAHSANKSQGGSSPTIPPAVLKPSLSTIEEAKANGFLEGSALVETPTEKAIDPMTNATLPSEFTHKVNGPPQLLNGTL